MKSTKIIYWAFTVLLSAFIVSGAILDILKGPDVVSFFKHLGYPEYFPRFIGLLKLLGIAAILTPGIPKIKEWAYAGLTFDVAGALSSHLLNGDPPTIWMPAFIGLVLVTGSYLFYRKKLKLSLKITE
ncbi:DoxX family protein [Mucilaginibacter ginsenosidivorans]|uniref:DoxX family protein n=1 Tax=Mucilaginibacter ginsenosidivorans TaxID=398053 RepID=A0A5B8UYN1_9SPHI|nr:DoxX family protein [Mucilaginibacter ginsenosidivorans]QEC64214.1 DoxX family protein [Mucilaginibacter ginsenosidivorans]